MSKYVPTPVNHPDELTPTQRQVLALLAAGASDKDIARQLLISRQTVKNHCMHIYKRMPGPCTGSPRILAARWLWEAQR